jgi:PPOX class probable F420-dependent enzyme
MSATGLRALENRVYRLIRHRDAAAAAESAPATDGFEGLEAHKYCLVVTYRRDGTPVPTPVWFAPARGRLVFESDSDSAKVKRLRRNPHVRVAPCNSRGRPLGSPVTGVARILSADESETAELALAERYGRSRQIAQRLRPAAPGHTYVEVQVAAESPPRRQNPS